MADYNVRGKMTLDTGSFISSARSASDSLNGLNTSIGGTSNSLKYLKRGVLAAGVALGGLAAAGIKAASDYQQAQIAFTKMLGSAEKSTQMIKELQDFAAATPFELPQLLQGSKKLMAFGFEAGQVIPMLTAIGDAASGLSLGSEGIDRLTLAIGQMQAKGKVSGGELRQLAEAGIPALQYLADAYGKTTAEIMKMSEDGAIPAAAGVGILIKGMEDGSKNAMGFKGMMEAQSKTMAGLMSTLKDTVRNAFVNGFNKYVPQISTVFEKMITKVGPIVQSIIDVMGYLVSQIGQILGGIWTLVQPLFENFLVPAFKILGAAILVLITAFAKVGAFIKSQAGFFQALVTVVGIAALAYTGLYVGVGIYNAIAAVNIARTKLMAIWTARQTIATTALTTAQRLLNLTMAFNPIGLIIAAAIALIGVFVALWNHSEAFRKAVIFLAKGVVSYVAFMIRAWGGLIETILKVVTGPLRLFLGVLSHLPGVGGAAKKGLELVNKGIEGVGNFAESTAKKVEGFSKTLDSLQNKKIKLPSFKLPGTGKDTKTPAETINDGTFNFDASALEGAVDETGQKIAEKVAELKANLTEVVQSYNDFITNDFAKGFVDGAENARDTMLKGLDELKKVFDAQQAIFEATKDTAGLAKVKSEWDKINNYVRGRIAEAMAVAAELEQVSKDLDDAYARLKEAVTARTAGADAFKEMLRTPFGTQSEIQKAMASGEATVDGIISMYDKMRDAIDKRFTDIGGGKKDQLISYLTDQTAKLVALAKRRDLAAKALDEAQKHLDDVLSNQASFKTSIVDSIKSFGTALADLSKTNGDNTIKVIKTASGLVITQMSQAKNGVDVITDKLKANLKTIQDFTTNIQILLTKGFNKEYVRQLLEAGPEAAGATAALLAQSGDDTVNTVNDLYAQINSASEQFGTKMSDTFYANSVSMAQAMVNGAQSEYENIMKEMKSIADGIEAAFAPLADVGTVVGNDIVQDLINSLEARRAELIARANAIAAEVAAAMAAAASAIGVGGVTAIITPNGGGPAVTTTTPEVTTTPETTPAPTTTTPTNPTTTTTKPNPVVAAATKVIVKAGDTLSAIAKANDTSLAAILAANPKFTDQAKYQNGNMIWSGTTVNIPAPKVAAPVSNGIGTFTSDRAMDAKIAATTIEKGAVTVNLGSNIPAADVEPIMTRALLNALGAR